jgi:hypothetical protein
MDVVYSGDGSTALWLGEGVGDEPRTVWWANLEDKRPLPRQTNLVVSLRANLALSFAGDSLAILEAGTLSIFDLSHERLTKAIRLPRDLGGVTVLFPFEETLRLFARKGHGDEQSLLIFEIQVATGRIVRTGIIGDVGDHPVLVVDGGVKHLVVRKRGEDGTPDRNRICDANDGSVISEVPMTGLPLFLRDGRLVSLHVDGHEMTHLVVESITGGDRISRPIGGGIDTILRGEAVPNGVVVSRLEDPSERTLGKRIDVIDVDSGEVRTVGRHLRRAVGSLPWQRGSAGFVIWYRDDPKVSRLLIDQTGALLRWNPETGDLVHVIGSN